MCTDVTLMAETGLSSYTFTHTCVLTFLRPAGDFFPTTRLLAVQYRIVAGFLGVSSQGAFCSIVMLTGAGLTHCQLSSVNWNLMFNK